ncbi:hypothetical protein PtA15_18A290 [Puccinia triticina]|uniref:Uncharacterized protein n=1 Tax=Puccinia triticina TaxID=208348 RepID=A0ABY7D970_9BASI|nr:uncharacterized protein PtA15_18A290 [Puccinia triticina]WAQ93232.1 hypothetical protein PtA15_18A290 [Puccinia triticina]
MKPPPSPKPRPSSPAQPQIQGSKTLRTAPAATQPSTTLTSHSTPAPPNSTLRNRGTPRGFQFYTSLKSSRIIITSYNSPKLSSHILDGSSQQSKSL